MKNFLWDLSMDAGHDEETGDSETTGWYALFDWSSDPDEFVELAKEYGLTSTRVASTDIRQRAGAIISQTSDGTIRLSLFSTKKELMEEWDILLEETAEDDD